MTSDTPRKAASLARNLGYASASAGSAAFLLTLLLLAGRLLGEEEYGKFSFALALGTIFETLMDFGLHQVTIRSVARDRGSAGHVLRNTLGLKLVWASGALVALVAAATVARPEADVRLACYLIGGSLVLRSYMLTVRGVFQGLEQFGWDSLVVIADRLLLLVAGAWALVAGQGLQGIAVAFVVSRAIALVLTAVLARLRIGPLWPTFQPDTWRTLQASALPLGVFLVVLNLYSYVDAVMLGILRTDVETGFYTAAYRVYEGLTYVPSVIASVLTPRLARHFVEDRLRHRRLALTGLGTAAGLGVAVGAVSYLLADPIMTGLFGVQYSPAASPFRILSVGLAFVYAIWVLHATAISVNEERLLLRTGIVGLVVNVGLNAYLIPHHGIEGAATATIAGELVSLVMLVAGLHRSLSRSG